MNKKRSEAQITYISGLRASKAVLTNYAKGRYSDKTLVKHLVKYNKDREDLMNIHGSFEEYLESKIEYWNDARNYDSPVIDKANRGRARTNEEKLRGILGISRGLDFWEKEENAYFASVQETYNQIPESERKKIRKKYGNLDWDAAIYDTQTQEIIVPGANGNVIMSIKDHKAGEYDEESLSWR